MSGATGEHFRDVVILCIKSGLWDMDMQSISKRALVLFSAWFLRKQWASKQSTICKWHPVEYIKPHKSEHEHTVTREIFHSIVPTAEMLAARDQENLIHGQQAAAAAKPLNQGIKQLAPKTPGNRPAKTPLRVPLNDENGATVLGGGKKTIGKGNENAIFGISNGGKVENKAFVTPVGKDQLLQEISQS